MLVWDSSLDELKSHHMYPGGHCVEMPTKTPLDLSQLAGSGTSSDRQFRHVDLTNFTGTVEIVIMHMVIMHNFGNASSLGGNGARPVSDCP